MTVMTMIIRIIRMEKIDAAQELVRPDYLLY